MADSPYTMSVHYDEFVQMISKLRARDRREICKLVRQARTGVRHFHLEASRALTLDVFENTCVLRGVVMTVETISPTERIYRVVAVDFCIKDISARRYLYPPLMSQLLDATAAASLAASVRDAHDPEKEYAQHFRKICLMIKCAASRGENAVNTHIRAQYERTVADLRGLGYTVAPGRLPGRTLITW